MNIPSGYQSEIYKDNEGMYHFPVLIIYEEFNVTDYIQDFQEERLIGEILEIIFEKGVLPWDKDKKYSKSSCKLYFKCSKINSSTKLEDSFYYPLRKDESLIRVLTCKKLFMNGFPTVCVVSPISYKFYEHFLMKNVVVRRRDK